MKAKLALPPIGDVERIIGYRFKDDALLERALTHRSAQNERGSEERDRGHNERLEFLGDAVLGLVAADALYRASPDAEEGELTRRRAAYVSASAIAERVLPTGLDEHLRVGRGARRGGLARGTNVLSDAFEAVVGAVYLDGGVEAAREVVLRMLGPPPDEAPAEESAKTRLQERFQRLAGQVPRYVVEREGGLDHRPRFVARVHVFDVCFGEARGGSVREATRLAAEAALVRCDALDDDALTSALGRGQ